MRASIPILWLLCATAFAAGGKSSRNQGPWLHWTFDEPGDSTILLDASGRGRAGKAEGGVRREEGPSGRAATGFESPAARIRSMPPNTPRPGPFPKTWTFHCFFRDPMPLPDRPALIARAVPDEGDDVPWQLWIERSGAVCLGVQDAKGHVATERCEGITWKRGTWFHAIVTHETTSQKGDKDWTERYRVWISPADSALGDPILDHEFRFPVRGADAMALQVGGCEAGRDASAAPAGALGKGSILDEVAVWPRILSDEELAAAHAAFLGAAGGAEAPVAAPDEIAKMLALRWTFDEPDKRPIAKDSSGNSRDGISADRVRGGVPGRRGGKAFDGFGTFESFVEGLVPDGAFRDEWTLVLWMKNPRLSSKQCCVIAGAKPTDKESNIAWQIWLDSKGTPHAAAQDSSGRRYAAEGNPQRWQPNAWHFVAITHHNGKDAFGIRRDMFKVWVVPEGQKPGTPLLDCEVGRDKLLADATSLRVGAAPVPKGKRVEIAPGGYFGGQIDEVALYVGRAFSAEDLASVMVPATAQ